MELLFLMLLTLPTLVEHSSDPSPGIFQSKKAARNLECEHLSQAQAHALYPTQVPELPARGTHAVNNALVCTPRIMNHGERPARDELILSNLSKSVGEITDAAAALGHSDLTWHVDSFYPDARVASKISVAARTDLAESGRKVSDRVPLLAAGDLAVLSRLSPQESWPLACTRYFAEGSLTERDAFLGVMIVDPRETQLHAGVCLGGEWRWLQ